MADATASSIPALYKRWRNGENEAGQEMAQRFSDWYYAITVSRLGEQQGRDPLQRACERFANEILAITSAGELVEWAHGVVNAEVERAGSRISGGDFPNALTARRLPSQILVDAWSALPREGLTLLAHAYDASFPMDRLVQDAEAMGGYPLAVLQARLDLKRWLRDTCSVPFSIVPDSPHLDSAPLPVYEAGRMTNVKEETRFERWLLSRDDLCRDIAEFAVFALAVRAGALAHPAPAHTTAPERVRRTGAHPAARTPMPVRSPSRSAPVAPFQQPAPPTRGGIPVAVVVGLGVVILLLVAVVVLLAFRA